MLRQNTSTGSVVLTAQDGSQFLFGGTRRSVKLSRPVEAGTLFDSTQTKCPFHRQDEVALWESPEDGTPVIRVLGNAFTPHYRHSLVIPRDCSNEMFVRTLGGTEFLLRCFEVIAQRTAGTSEEWVFAVHVFRGQNVPHLHWHLYAYHPEEKLDLARESGWSCPEENPNLIIWRTENFQVVSRGVNTGQLMIIPNEPITADPSYAAVTLNFSEAAKILSDVVTLTNTAFMSTQGEFPRYSVTGRIGNGGQLHYLTYVPDLQPRGCSDDAADLNGSARARAWSPMETAEYLRNK